jgi:hypothetical protein
MVLGRSAQAQKHSTENVRQSFHLVKPPKFWFEAHIQKLQKGACGKAAPCKRR